MTYTTESNNVGRTPFTMVRLALDYCQETYGVSPCTASTPPKCFNTRATCHDVNNYNPATTTTNIYLTDVSEYIPNGIYDLSDVGAVLPCLRTINTAPSRLDPGKGLGTRAALTITCGDQPHNDVGLDKYASERTYDAATQGTFFGKLLARNPYFLGRVVTVFRGYLVDGVFDISNFIQQDYVIESINGPNSKYLVTITAKDILKLADNTRAQIPAPSTGELDATITAVATSLTVQTGAGSQYSNGDTIRIEEELITVGTVSVDTLSGLTRGVFGSVVDAHDIASSVQKCKVYTSENVTDIVENLLTEGANISTSNIDLVGFAAEKAGLLAANNLTAVISEPTGINKLLNEISVENLLFLWYDDESNIIRLKAIAPAAGLPVINYDSSILSDTTLPKIREDLRVSQFQMYYALSDYTQTDTGFYRKLFINISTDSEGPQKYNSSRIAQIKSRWFDATLDSVVSQTGNRTVLMFQDSPREASFNMDAKETLKVGDLFTLQTRQIQDPDGLPVDVTMVVLEKRTIVEGTTYGYLARELRTSGNVAKIAPSGTVDYGSAPDTIKDQYAFISDATEVFPDGRGAYVIF